MGFPKQTPKAFTRGNVERLNPNQMGVYGLFFKSRWIYIGSGDIKSRLHAHLSGNNPCITTELPTHWVDEVIPSYAEREKALIDEHKPVCNKGG